MKKDTQIIRKQSLIAKTRKAIIFWVAGASIFVGAAVVVSGILIQHLMFNYKVMSKQQETIRTIAKNAEQVRGIEEDLRILSTDEQLIQARSSSDAEALQTVLDALPADANRLALGSSLERKIFKNVAGLEVQALSVENASGAVSTGSIEGLGTLSFSATISGSPEVLKKTLERVERSVRSLDVQTVNGTSSGTNVTLTLTGVAYYLEPVDLSLKSTEVRS